MRRFITQIFKELDEPKLDRDEYYNTFEVAEILGVARSTLERYRKTGRAKGLIFKRVGREILYTRESVMEVKAIRDQYKKLWGAE